MYKDIYKYQILYNYYYLQLWQSKTYDGKSWN